MLSHKTEWMRVPIRGDPNPHARPVTVRICAGHRYRERCFCLELVLSRSFARRASSSTS
jgi:hypothetical protein